MRGIAGKQHPAMAEAAHAPALEGVDADPFERELAPGPQHGLDARDHPLGLFLLLRVGVPTELEVDAPDLVGLAVQKYAAGLRALPSVHAVVAVEGRVEPEPALGREIGRHHHIGDQEAVLEDLAVDVQAQLAPHRAARAVGHHQPVGLQLIVAVGGLYIEQHAVGLWRHLGQLVLPAQVEMGQLAGARDQVFLQVVLLQVDHAGPLMAGLGLQVELEDLTLAKEGAADVPGDALVHHRLAAAQAVQDLQRALGPAQPA